MIHPGSLCHCKPNYGHRFTTNNNSRLVFSNITRKLLSSHDWNLSFINFKHDWVKGNISVFSIQDAMLAVLLVNYWCNYLKYVKTCFMYVFTNEIFLWLDAKNTELLLKFTNCMKSNIQVICVWVLIGNDEIVKTKLLSK